VDPRTHGATLLERAGRLGPGSYGAFRSTSLLVPLPHAGFTAIAHHLLISIRRGLGITAGEAAPPGIGMVLTGSRCPPLFFTHASSSHRTSSPFIASSDISPDSCFTTLRVHAHSHLRDVRRYHPVCVIAFDCLAVNGSPYLHLRCSRSCIARRGTAWTRAGGGQTSSHSEPRLSRRAHCWSNRLCPYSAGKPTLLRHIPKARRFGSATERYPKP